MMTTGSRSRLALVGLVLLIASVACRVDELEISLEDVSEMLPLETLAAEAQKLTAQFSDGLPIKQLDDYFRFFQRELETEEAKKLFAKLVALSSDIDAAVHASPYTSIKQVNEFIGNGLMKISQEFNLDHESFSSKADFDAEHAQFVVDHNGADAELLKSADWNAKPRQTEKELEDEEYGRRVIQEELSERDRFPYQDYQTAQEAANFEDVHGEFFESPITDDHQADEFSGFKVKRVN